MGTTRFRQSVLTGKQNLDQLFAAGRFVSGPGCSVRVLRRGEDEAGQPSRFVICVSRKAGKAVRRNRMRRVVRESLDPMIPDIRNGYFVALFPGGAFAQQSPSERGAILERVFRKARLIAKPPVSSPMNDGV